MAVVVSRTYSRSLLVQPFAATRTPRYLNARLPRNGVRGSPPSLTADVLTSRLLRKLKPVTSHFFRFILIPDHSLKARRVSNSVFMSVIEFVISAISSANAHAFVRTPHACRNPTPALAMPRRHMLMKRAKSVGLRVSPCGVPLVIGTSHVAPKSVTTCSCAPSCKRRMTRMSSACMPDHSSIWKSLLWGTEQNAENQSM
mmetsp:Transcript_62138/g.128823  ORF Transcript_62138/g.128823 Transcript_62138/m.128823 type:complete len:200 (-) Transcript_62138:2489-3088(-)